MTTRPRIVGGVVALGALTAALVLGGVTVALADDGLEFTTPGDGSVVPATGGTVTLAGTTTHTDPGETIDIWDYSSGGSPDPLCLGLDPTSGTWSCDVDLSPGAKEIHAVQPSATDVLEFELRLPAPVVTGPALVAAGGTVNLTGVDGYPFATVTAVITTPNEPGLTCDDVVAPDGTWACDIPFDAELPPDSDATATVTQTDGFAVSPPTAHEFHVGLAPPAQVTIASPVDAAELVWQSGPNIPVSGSAPLGTGVDIAVDGVPVPACQGLVPDPNAQWSCGSISEAPGPHTIRATQGVDVDEVAVDLVAPAPEPGGLPLSADEGDPEFTVGGGYGLDGYRVFVSVEWAIETYVECDSPVALGSWSCDLDLSGVPAGSYDLHVVQRPDPEDPSISSVVGSHPFEIVAPPPPPAPNLSCAYSPNGGISITSAYLMEVLAIYRAYLEGGSFDPDPFQYPGACNGGSGTPFPDSDEVWFDEVASCDDSCAASGLAPGLYEVYYRVSDADETPGVSYETHSYLFTIPEAPTISAVASTTSSVVLSGAATAGDQVRVVRSNGSTLCTTTATGAGTWACQFPKSSASSARALAVDPSSGGMSAHSAFRSIPVFEPEAPGDEQPAVVLINWFLQFDGDLSNLKPGDRFTLNVSGMPEGTEIEVWMHSTPRLLGTATGTGLPMALQLTVPDDIENGPHEIRMTGVTPLGTQYFFSSDAMVTGGVDPVDTPEEPAGEEPDDGTGSGGGAVDRSDPGAPSALSESLAPLDRIVANPIAIAVAGGLALALLFLVALPTELLNSSLSSNTSRLGRAYGAIDGAMSRAQDWFIRVTRSRALAAGLLTLAVAVVYGFVDPGFGFDVVSLRLVLALAIAFFVLSYGASWLSGLVIRRLWGTTGVIALQPSVILFAIVGVVVARILDFSPGFLVGIAIGLELIAASRRVSARAVLVQFLFVVGLSLAAWVVYSLFTPGDDFAGMLVEDTMVAITAEGLTGALIAVFPLQFLDGRELWLESKRLWVAAFLLVAVPFALLVLPTAIEGTEVSDYGTWLLVFAVFGLVSIGIWLVFARAAKREEEAEAATLESADA